MGFLKEGERLVAERRSIKQCRRGVLAGFDQTGKLLLQQLGPGRAGPQLGCAASCMVNRSLDTCSKSAPGIRLDFFCH